MVGWLGWVVGGVGVVEGVKEVQVGGCEKKLIVHLNFAGKSGYPLKIMRVWSVKIPGMAASLEEIKKEIRNILNFS